MEIRLNLGQIRSRVLARLGTSTDELVFGQSKEQIDSYINAATLHVLSVYDWPTTRLEEVTLAWPANTPSASGRYLGIDQRFLDYPTGGTPGSVKEIAIWLEDQNRYSTLKRSALPVGLHSDAADVIGGGADEEWRGEPQFYREGNQIEVWPIPEKQYQIKIVYHRTAELVTDDDVSPVDAELIILWTYADMLDFQGEPRLAEVQRSKFQVRANRLKHTLHARENIRFGRNRGKDRHAPNYDTRPSTL